MECISTTGLGYPRYYAKLPDPNLAMQVTGSGTGHYVLSRCWLSPGASSKAHHVPIPHSGVAPASACVQPHRMVDVHTP
jgi:hypothetical protein